MFGWQQAAHAVTLSLYSPTIAEFQRQSTEPATCLLPACQKGATKGWRLQAWIQGLAYLHKQPPTIT